MLKMDSAGRSSVSKLIQSNTIPEGHSVENFLKQNMLLKSVTMKNKSTEKINIVLSSSRSIKEKSRQKKIASRFNSKKVKFIDELDKTKSLCEVVEIESFKVYNIDISEERLTQKCTCLFF